MIFEVSGVEVAVVGPPAGGVRDLVLHLHGRRLRRVLVPAVPDERARLHLRPSVSATDQLYNVVAIPGGVLALIREGRLVWPLSRAVVAGHPARGAHRRDRSGHLLPDPRPFKLFAGLVLLSSVGAWSAISCRNRRSTAKTTQSSASSARRSGQTDRGPVCRSRTRFSFSASPSIPGRALRGPTGGIVLLSFVVGIVGGIYGIGGGAIIAPFFIAIYGLPVYTVAGAALMGTFVTSVAGVAFYQAIAPFYPDRPWRRTGPWACSSASAAWSACTSAPAPRSSSRLAYQDDALPDHPVHRDQYVVGF